MASFVYNIYDIDDNSIDCFFQFYHTNTKKLSSIRESSDYQISFDSDDSDINDQQNTFKDGDIGLIVLWVPDDLNNNTRLDKHTLFGMKIITGDDANDDIYTGDIKLFSSVAPSANLIINDSTEGIEFNCSQNSSDEYQLNNIYHRNYSFGISIFDQVGIDKVEYNFGEGFQKDSNYTFNETGKYLIELKVTNKYTQETIIQDYIYIRKNVPDVILESSPDILYTGDEYTLTGTINNTEDVTNIQYYIDDIEIENNYSSSFSEIKTHIYKLEFDFWNGFETVHIINTKNINLEVRPGSIGLEIIKEDDYHKLVSNIVLGDGEINYINYIIYYTLPFNSNIEKVFTKTVDVIDLEAILEMSFESSGKYDIHIKATDEYNINYSDTKNITIDCDNTSEYLNKPKITYFFDVE